MSDFYDHKDDWYRIELNLNEHKDDTIKHITDTERQNWNDKSDAHDHPYAPLSHVGDDTHVTSAEKSTWNGKATASDISAAIQTHLTNTSHGSLVPNWAEASVITGANNVASHTATKPGIVYITDNMNSQSHCCDIYINDILVDKCDGIITIFIKNSEELNFSSISFILLNSLKYAKCQSNLL